MACRNPDSRARWRSIRRAAPAWVLSLLVFALGGGCGGQFGVGSSAGGAAGNTATGGSSGAGASATGGTAGVGGGGVDFRACTVNSDCALRAASCCGMCGAPTRADVIALNRASMAAYADSVCDAGQACPACAAQTDPTLIATCNQGRCEVVDLQTSPLTACTDDTACVLRTNTCCECTGPLDPSKIIALNHATVADFTQLVCDPNSACPSPCAPIYPPTVQPVCESNHCVATSN